MDFTCDSKSVSDNLQEYVRTRKGRMKDKGEKVKTWYVDQVKAEDSVRQTGCHTSSSTASKPAAREAALKSQVEALKKTQAIKWQQLKLEREAKVVKLGA